MAGRARHTAEEGSDDWLSRVARKAAADANAPIDLLGEYLVILSRAALTSERPQRSQLAAVRRLGRRAAEQGVDADQAVDLYLSAAWRLWREVPAVVRTRDRDAVSDAAEAVLHVVNDAVEALVDGHQAARREMIRQEEAARREFIDDLLRGDADVSRLVERAEPFGLDLGRAHQVLLAESLGRTPDAGALDSAAVAMERVVVKRYGDRDVLVATKDALLVVLIPGDPETADPASGQPQRFVHDRLVRHIPSRRWQVAAGRPHPGAYGIARSYEEAREALTLARRLHLDAGAIQPRDLLVYRVLGRDHAALADLVQALLGPLTRSRGGAEPLLRTLETYYATGCVATAAARRLHLSVRTVTYRLDKVRALTGVDPTDPTERLSLHLAVLGARLLDWPTSDLTASSSR